MPSEFGRFLNVLNTEIELKAFKYIQQIAEEMTQEAIEILEEQRYRWVKLSQKYLDWKVRKNLDTRVLIATGFYQDHISWGIKDDTVWFGVEDVTHEPSGLPLRVLARIHEFGTKTIPARPLWRPLLSKYIRLYPQLGKRYRKEVQKAALKKKKKITRSKTLKVKF